MIVYRGEMRLHASAGSRSRQLGADLSEAVKFASVKTAMADAVISCVCVCVWLVLLLA